MRITPTPTADATTGSSELDQLIAATGNSYYRKPFEKFASDGRISASWNWAASFFGMYWLFRRDMMAYAIGYMVAGQIAFALIPPWLFAYFAIRLAIDPGSIPQGEITYRLAFSVASVLAFPCYANALYYGHLRYLLRKGKLAAHASGAGRPKTRVTNYLGYIIAAVIVALIAAVVIPVYQQREVRASIREVFSSSRNAQAKVEDYVRINGRLPDVPGEVDPGKISHPSYLGEVRVETGGAIRLVLTGPDLFATPNLQGKSIILVPVFEAGKITSWRCISDIPDWALPGTCRKE